MKYYEDAPLDMISDKNHVLYSLISYALGTILMIGSIFPILSFVNALNMYLTIYRTNTFYEASSNRLIMLGTLFITGIVWISGFFLLQGKIEKDIYRNKRSVIITFVVTVLSEAIAFVCAYLLTAWIKG